MKVTDEIWQPVIGYEGLYSVSNLGRVRSEERYRIGKGGASVFVSSRIMRLHKLHNGYLHVMLSKESKTRQTLVHRLVAQAFINNPCSLKCVDHINGIRDDNRVENLRWCSHKENLNFELARSNISKSAILSIKKHEHLKRIQEGCRKRVAAITPDNKVIEFEALIDAEKALNVNHSKISAVCRGRIPHCKGYKFYYLDN